MRPVLWHDKSFRGGVSSPMLQDVLRSRVVSPAEERNSFVDCWGSQPQSRKTESSPGAIRGQKMSQLQRFRRRAGEVHRPSSIHGKGAGTMSRERLQQAVKRS